LCARAARPLPSPPRPAELVLPGLIRQKVFVVTEPPQVLALLIGRLDFLLDNSPEDAADHHVIPVLFRALESGHAATQEAALAAVPDASKRMSHATFKNSLLPRICTLCLETDKLSVRVKSLLALSKLFDIVDKWTVQEKVIPCIQMIPSREPPVLMAILGVFNEMIASPKLHIDKETIAGVVIPYLSPLCLDAGLNARQFKTFMGVLHSLLKYVEAAHAAKLDQAEVLAATPQTHPPAKAAAAGAKAAETEERMRALLNGAARPTDMRAILTGSGSHGNANPREDVEPAPAGRGSQRPQPPSNPQSPTEQRPPAAQSQSQPARAPIPIPIPSTLHTAGAPAARPAAQSRPPRPQSSFNQKAGSQAANGQLFSGLGASPNRPPPTQQQANAMARNQPPNTAQQSRPMGWSQSTQPAQPTGWSQSTQPAQPTGWSQNTQPAQPTGWSQSTQPAQSGGWSLVHPAAKQPASGVGWAPSTHPNQTQAGSTAENYAANVQNQVWTEPLANDSRHPLRHSCIAAPHRLQLDALLLGDVSTGTGEEARTWSGGLTGTGSLI
jgi:SCY1-like protein 2